MHVVAKMDARLLAAGTEDEAEREFHRSATVWRQAGIRRRSESRCKLINPAGGPAVPQARQARKNHGGFPCDYFTLHAGFC
jgi:hypothetical protein